MAISPESLLAQAREIQPRLVAMRRELHEYPELAMEEFETTRRLRGWLAEAGLALLDLDLPVGVLAEVAGAQPGPTVALRADIDALPVTEETGLPYASRIPGRMHACGHDFHSATMVGAAILLQQHAAELKGRVRILFQPAEERTIGAKAMIEAGALKGVKAILGMHNKPDLPVGTVGVKSGPLMAAADRFIIRVTGKGGHGAAPETAVDPIVAASSIVTSLQSIVSRNVSPLQSAVVSVCSFQAGATWNVIPATATLEGTVRTFESSVRHQIERLIRRVAEGVAAGYGCTAELEWISLAPEVYNDPAMAGLMQAAATELGLRVVEAERTTGSEDFSLYQQLVPGCFIWMGGGGTENWHHPRFTVNEEALPISAALFAWAAVRALEAMA